MIGYIYLTVNKVNGKTYVGQRKFIKKNKNKSWKESYLGSGIHIKKAILKYGKENFEKFLIQYCETKDELNEQEKFWIAEYRRRGKAEYNIADGGQGGIKCPSISEACKGRKASEEQKKKMSEKYKGSGNPFFGKKHSLETIEKIKAARARQEAEGRGPRKHKKEE